MAKKQRKLNRTPISGIVTPETEILAPRQKDHIVLALDNIDITDAGKAVVELNVDRFHPYFHSFKLPLELYPHGVIGLKSVRIFLDLKLHHDPETTFREAKHFAGLGVRYFTVDAYAGTDAMRAAVEGGGPKCTAIASTVPTWLGKEEIERCFGLSEQEKLHFLEYRTCKAPVSHMSAVVISKAREAIHAGINSIVCSVHELMDINVYARHFPEFRKLDVFVAGNKPPWYRPVVDHQKRTGTPGLAMQHGARALIIGRPVIHPPPDISSRTDALERILAETIPYTGETRS